MAGIEFFETLNPYKESPNKIMANYYKLKSYVDKIFKWTSIGSAVVVPLTGATLLYKGAREGNIEEMYLGAITLITGMGLVKVAPALAGYFEDNEYYDKEFSKVYMGEREWSFWRTGIDSKGRSTGLKPIKMK